jgi:hypothetical protein
MITPAITRSGIVFRKPSRIIRKPKYYQNKPSRRRPTPTPESTPTPTPTPTPPPPPQSIFSRMFRFGFRGGKHKITRKRRK